jgi:alpha-1,6-mannosyltransferase
LETFCLAALESLASGTPVVASEKSAVGEFLLLDQNNPAGATASDNRFSFADAITSVIGRRRIRIQARAVAEKFPWEATVLTMRSHHGITELGQGAPFVSTKPRLKAS